MEDANIHEVGGVKAKALLDIFAVKTDRNLQDLSRVSQGGGARGPEGISFKS